MPAALRLPACAKHLLLAAHLASRFPPRLDVAIFSVVRRGGGGKRRRALRKPPAAEEPHAFTLERLLAIYDSVCACPPLLRSPGAAGPCGGAGGRAPRNTSFEPRAPCLPCRRRHHRLVPPLPAHPPPCPPSPSPPLTALQIQNETELMPLRVEVLVQLGTLIQQGLVARVSSEAVLEGMRLRCEAPADTLQLAADEVKFDLKRFFDDV